MRTSRSGIVRWPWWGVSAALLWSAQASAQCRDPRYQDVEERWATGQHDEAIELADVIRRDTTLPCAAVRLAVLEKQLGRWVEAERHVQSALEQAADPWVRQRQRDLQSLLQEIRSHLGNLHVTSATTGAALSIDGRSIPLPMLAPLRTTVGEHQVHLEGREHLPEDVTVEVTTGVEAVARVEVVLLRPLPPPPLPPPPPPPPAPPPPPFSPGATPWVLTGVGAANVIASVVIFAVPRADASPDSYPAWNAAAFATLAAGGVALGTGLLWWFLDRTRAATRPPGRIGLAVHVDRVVVSGSF